VSAKAEHHRHRTLALSTCHARRGLLPTLGGRLLGARREIKARCQMLRIWYAMVQPQYHDVDSGAVCGGGLSSLKVLHRRSDNQSLPASIADLRPDDDSSY